MGAPLPCRFTHSSIAVLNPKPGTGGTIAGISRYFQERNPACKSYLIDPPGSSLFNKVRACMMMAAN